METTITSCCKLKNNSVWVNDVLTLQGNFNEDAAGFLGSLYKSMELNYPKFFKMDKLCKLGTLATEIMIRNIPGFISFPKNEIAVVFSNNASSLESDRTHATAISDKQNYFPSPSVFVYTLPNMVVGEIAIKHKITGENAFFVSEKFDPELMSSYADILLRTNQASTVLGGWVNVDGTDMEAFVYCVKNLNFKQEKDLFQIPHTAKNIHDLYSL